MSPLTTPSGSFYFGVTRPSRYNDFGQNGQTGGLGETQVIAHKISTTLQLCEIDLKSGAGSCGMNNLVNGVLTLQYLIVERQLDVSYLRWGGPNQTQDFISGDIDFDSQMAYDIDKVEIKGGGAGLGCEVALSACTCFEFNGRFVGGVNIGTSNIQRKEPAPDLRSISQSCKVVDIL